MVDTRAQVRNRRVIRGRDVVAPQQGGMLAMPTRPKLLEAHERPRNTIKVRAKNEKFAKAINFLFARLGRAGFSSDGTAEWPRDAYTARRIREGDVTVVEAEPQQQPREREQRRVTHQRSNTESHS